MRGRIVAIFFVILACFASAPRSVSAGEREDNATTTAVDKIVAQDVAQANFGEAKKKLKALIDRCKKNCSPSALAHVHVALGMVAAQIGQPDEAKTEWTDALNLDPGAALPSSGVSAAVRTQFDETQKAWIAANPQPDDAQKAGWVNKQAFDSAKAAIAAESTGNFAECVDKDKAALLLEENLRSRAHLALCEAKIGKVLDALRDNAKALEAARQKNDAATLKLVQERVTALLPRLAHVKFTLPTGSSGVSDLKVTFDERPIPPERYAESFTIDPGAHTVHAEGILRGARVSSDDKVQVADGETVVVKVTLKPAALTGGQLECMVAAKTQEDILRCLPSDTKPLTVHLGLDFSGYTDSLAVHVLSPAIRGSVASPAGWSVGAGYLIDVVSAASPDIVASASPRFTDLRHAVNVDGGYKPGDFGVHVNGNYSTEHDYVSRTLGGTVIGDFAEKAISPSLGFAHTWDTIGRTGTDFDVYSKSFQTEEISAGATFILTPTSLLVTGATVALEHGDQSKPYRYVPLFEPGVSVPIGADVSEVNALRLPAKPLEQLPTDRQRFSIGALYIRRLSTATLRLEERIYSDTWGIKATTTDVRYMMDITSRLRLWPHGHLHVQSGAGFYQRIYGATLNSDGSATIPQYRSTDRELSPMFGVTGGGGAHFQITDPSAKFQLALYSSADVMFNDYFNALYVRTRIAFYGTFGVEADFE